MTYETRGELIPPGCGCHVVQCTWGPPPRALPVSNSNKPVIPISCYGCKEPTPLCRCPKPTSEHMGVVISYKYDK
jgi:hypothetical protein